MIKVTNGTVFVMGLVALLLELIAFEGIALGLWRYAFAGLGASSSVVLLTALIMWPIETRR